MQAGQPSRTALGAAAHRAVHQVLEGGCIFADPLAVRLLGADLETAVRKAKSDPSRRRLRLFIEVDQPATQAWKRQRLAEAACGSTSLALGRHFGGASSAFGGAAQPSRLDAATSGERSRMAARLRSEGAVRLDLAGARASFRRSEQRFRGCGATLKARCGNERRAQPNSFRRSERGFQGVRRNPQGSMWQRAASAAEFISAERAGVSGGAAQHPLTQ